MHISHLFECVTRFIIENIDHSKLSCLVGDSYNKEIHYRIVASIVHVLVNQYLYLNMIACLHKCLYFSGGCHRRM